MQRQQIRSRTILALALSIPATASLGTAQGASFEGLGFFPGTPAEWSEAHAVSADGKRVSGFARTPGSDFAMEPFLWQEGTGMIGLGHMPVTGGLEQGRALGISGDGTVVVGSGNEGDFGGDTVAFTWTRAAGLVPHGKLFNAFSSTALVASHDGSVAGGSSKFIGNGDTGMGGWREGTIFMGGATVGVGSLPGALRSEVFGISSDGSSAVGVATRPPLEGQSAFRWTAAEGLVDLGDFPAGFDFSAAYAVSADGSVVVGFGTISFQAAWVTDQRACRWVDGVIEAYPELPFGTFSQANAVTPDGRTAAGWTRRFGHRQASVWNEAADALDLHELMEANGIDMSDWTWTEATGISASGKVIVGWGRRNSFPGVEAWRAMLP